MGSPLGRPVTHYVMFFWQKKNHYIICERSLIKAHLFLPPSKQKYHFSTPKKDPISLFAVLQGDSVPRGCQCGGTVSIILEMVKKKTSFLGKILFFFLGKKKKKKKKKK